MPKLVPQYAGTKEIVGKYLGKGRLKDRIEAFGELPMGPDMSADYLIACTDAILVGLLSDIQGATEDGSPLSMAQSQMFASLSKVALNARQYEIDRRVAASNVIGRAQAEAFVEGMVGLIGVVIPDDEIKRRRFEEGVRALLVQHFPQSD